LRAWSAVCPPSHRDPERRLAPPSSPFEIPPTPVGEKSPKSERLTERSVPPAQKSQLKRAGSDAAAQPKETVKKIERSPMVTRTSGFVRRRVGGLLANEAHVAAVPRGARLFARQRAAGDPLFAGCRAGTDPLRAAVGPRTATGERPVVDAGVDGRRRIVVIVAGDHRRERGKSKRGKREHSCRKHLHRDILEGAELQANLGSSHTRNRSSNAIIYPSRTTCSEDRKGKIRNQSFG